MEIADVNARLIAKLAPKLEIAGDLMSIAPGLAAYPFLTLAFIESFQVKEALLREQYFPAVKAAGEEFPPLFHSNTFGDSIAGSLAASGDAKPKSWVEFRSRRFDGLVRRMGIPHPVAYSRLVEHVSDNWGNLQPYLDSENSRLSPELKGDGKLIRMDYEEPRAAERVKVRMAQGRKYLIKSDISACFPSIYSHAIDWALRGKLIAKADRRSKGWQAKLDKLVQNCHHGETKGVMIGPAVSNVVAEVILQRVDADLRAKGYLFRRYIDDYESWCDDRAAGERFINDLQRALSEYRLDINRRKTEIVDLRQGISEEWISEIHSHLPSKWTTAAAMRFLRHAEMLAGRYPGKSVLKYAVKTLESMRVREEEEMTSDVVMEKVRICEFHPHLIPFVSKAIGQCRSSLSGTDVDQLKRVLETQMLEASARGETDVVLWYLYVLRVDLSVSVLKSVWSVLLDEGDDLVVLGVASLCNRARHSVLKTVLGWSYSCESDYEEHWLSRYELFRVGMLSDSDLHGTEKSWMKKMVAGGVAFTDLA